MFWGSVDSDAEAEAVCCGEDKAELEGKAFNIQVNLLHNFHL